jgi:hypothetical protein
LAEYQLLLGAALVPALAELLAAIVDRYDGAGDQEFLVPGVAAKAVAALT